MDVKRFWGISVASLAGASDRCVALESGRNEVCNRSSFLSTFFSSSLRLLFRKLHNHLSTCLSPTSSPPIPIPLPSLPTYLQPPHPSFPPLPSCPFLPTRPSPPLPPQNPKPPRNQRCSLPITGQLQGVPYCISKKYKQQGCLNGALAD